MLFRLHRKLCAQSDWHRQNQEGYTVHEHASKYWIPANTQLDTTCVHMNTTPRVIGRHVEETACVSQVPCTFALDLRSLFAQDQEAPAKPPGCCFALSV